MKWPNTLTVVRHGESAYNVLKEQKNQDPDYIAFKRAYDKRQKDLETAQRLAKQILDSGKYVLNVGEHDTAMTRKGERQAETTGARLRERIELPDVVLVSPYDRTINTLGFMAIGWPELKNVKQVEDERLREQEHGMAALYNDWRIFQVLYPEQEALRNRNGSYWYRYPQGESVPDVRERARSMVNTITRDYKEQNVMVITHHLWILALRANLERFGEEEYSRLDQHEKPINCGVTIYRGDPSKGKDGKLLLDIYNEQLYAAEDLIDA